MDLKRMMAQMQNQYGILEKKLSTMEVIGEAGGENGVIVKMNGKFEIKDVKINFLPTEKSDLEILEDLFKKAFSLCHAQIEAEVNKMKGGMF